MTLDSDFRDLRAETRDQVESGDVVTRLLGRRSWHLFVDSGIQVSTPINLRLTPCTVSAFFHPSLSLLLLLLIFSWLSPQD